ncbi:MAG TPA: RNA polymerase sigma factor [Gemmata sp.]|nr:RNA polymerase sigma factor [Gemmata sp.]
MPRPLPPDPEFQPQQVIEMAELGELFDTHWEKLVRIVRARIDPALGARIDPEDVVVQAFFIARRRWADYRNHRNPREFLWLYRLVNDRLLEAWRTATRECRNLQLEDAWPTQPSVALGLKLASPGDGPLTEAIRAEAAVRVREALDQLQIEDREVIMLRNFDGLPFGEIGVLMNQTENTVAVRYARALRKLRDVWRRLTGESQP